MFCALNIYNYLDNCYVYLAYVSLLLQLDCRLLKSQICSCVPLHCIAGLHNLHTLSLQGCRYISDSGLQRLLHVAETLQHLNLSSCSGITHRGLPQLYNLQ